MYIEAKHENKLFFSGRDIFPGISNKKKHDCFATKKSITTAAQLFKLMRLERLHGSRREVLSWPQNWLRGEKKKCRGMNSYIVVCSLLAGSTSAATLRKPGAASPPGRRWGQGPGRRALQSRQWWPQGKPTLRVLGIYHKLTLAPVISTIKVLPAPYRTLSRDILNSAEKTTISKRHCQKDNAENHPWAGSYQSRNF